MASVPLVARGVARGYVGKLCPWFGDKPIWVMEALLLPGSSPGLIFMCLFNKPALPGTKTGKKPHSISQAIGRDRNGQPWRWFTQDTGASSGPTANLRVSLLRLLLSHFTSEETEAPWGKRSIIKAQLSETFHPNISILRQSFCLLSFGHLSLISFS